jgi:hypothetical protein
LFVLLFAVSLGFHIHCIPLAYLLLSSIHILNKGMADPVPMTDDAAMAGAAARHVAAAAADFRASLAALTPDGSPSAAAAAATASAASASPEPLAIKHPGVLIGANPGEDADLTKDTTSFHFNVSSVTLCRANQPAAVTEQLLRVLAGENEVVYANPKAVVLRSLIGGAGAVPNPSRKFAFKLFSAQDPIKQEGRDDKLSRADIFARANTESIANYEFKLGCAASHRVPTLFPTYLGLVRLQCAAQKDTTICTQAEPTQRATTQCLITDFVKGKTLYERAQTPAYPLSRVLELIKVLFQRMEPVEMTHYDLHLANVMIEDDPSPDPWAGPGTPILRHAIKIIDMGRAYVRGALEPNVRYRCDGGLTFMVIGYHQGVFDPYIDFLQCLASLQSWYKENDVVLELLTELVRRWVHYSRTDMDNLGGPYLSVIPFDHAMQMQLNPYFSLMEGIYDPSEVGADGKRKEDTEVAAGLAMWNMDHVPPVEWKVLRETKFDPWLADLEELPNLAAQKQWRADHQREVWEALASLKKWYIHTYQGIVEFKKGEIMGTRLNRKQMVAWLSEILDRYIAQARTYEV